MAELVPLIEHLDPPMSTARLFGPSQSNHERSIAQGLTCVK